MEYKTIAQKVKEEFKNRTGQKCKCEKRINKKNIRYYIDQYNERKPICKDCYEIIKTFLPVVRS